MTDAEFQARMGVSDLNGERRFWQTSDFSSGGCHEHRPDAVRSTDRAKDFLAEIFLFIKIGS